MSIWDYVVNAVTWLLAYSSNVIAWIKYYAGQVANAISNSAIGRAYEVVRSWLSDVYWDVRRWVVRTYEDFKIKATAAYNWVQTAYGRVKNWISVELVPVWNSISEWVGQTIDTILAKAIETYNRVRAWVQPFIDWLDVQIGKVQEWISDVQAFVKDQINLFVPKTKERFTALFDDEWDDFSQFLFNPLGTILAMIVPIFMDIFCYAAAYALGTENESLPPWPSWDQLTQFGDGEAPAIVPSGLIPPLSNMYVSGYRFGSGHRATDYGCVYGCSVFACHGGTVEFAGWSSVGYGNCLTIRGGDWWSRYAHLMAFNVAVGQEVSAGQVIGGCDTTGNSTGDHLHLELKYKGKFINPETVF